jgi:hypothetical protein
MKVFLSWSGEPSRQVAEELRRWLPAVVQVLEPFASAADIASGERWSAEIATKLQETNFGIVCLTRSNVDKPWLNFEAGALSKSIADGRVVPYLLGMETADLPRGPLTQFQAKRANEEDTLALVQDLNAALDRRLSESALRDQFEHYWPRLARRLAKIQSDAGPPDEQPEHRTVDDMLARGLAPRPRPTAAPRAPNGRCTQPGGRDGHAARTRCRQRRPPASRAARDADATRHRGDGDSREGGASSSGDRKHVA